jgi:hypothetical protein
MKVFDVRRENDPLDRFLTRLILLDRAIPLAGKHFF